MVHFRTGFGDDASAQADAQTTAQINAHSGTAENENRKQAAQDALINAARGGGFSYANAKTVVVGALSMVSPAAGAMGFLVIQAGEWIGKGVRAVFGINEVAHSLTWQEFCDKFHARSPTEDGWFRWTDTHPPPPQRIAHSFEEFADPFLIANQEMFANCLPSVRESVLLRRLVEAWNTAHTGPTWTTIAPDYQNLSYDQMPHDPVSWALINIGTDTFNDPQNPNLPFFANPDNPHRPRITFNIGPALPAIIGGLHATSGGGLIGGIVASNSAPAPKPMSTGAKVAIGVGVVAGTGLAAALVAARVTGKPVSVVVKNAFKKVRP